MSEDILKEQNEYWDELVEKYDTDFVRGAVELYRNKKPNEIFDHMQLTQDLNDKIREAMDTEDPSSDLAMEMCGMHKEWVSFYWPSYDPQMHYNLVEMYGKDDRFIQYYTQIRKGSEKFLLEAMKHFFSNDVDVYE